MVAKWGAALLAVATVASAEILEPVYKAFPSGKVVRRQTANFAPDHQLDMDYAEMESYNSVDKDTIGATVHITTHDPAVQTEDFGGLVTDITCSNDNSMKITFANSDAAEQAKTQWTAPSMVIITLTSTCNEDGIRVPWQVSQPSFDGNVATLSGKPSDWDTVSSAMTVDFGNRGNVVNPDVKTNQTTQKIKRGDNFSADLGFKLEDKIIYPPEAFNSPAIPVPVAGRMTQTCKKCVGTGKATFSTGDMSFDIKAAVKDAAKAASQGVAAASSVANAGVASASVVATQGVAAASSVANVGVASASAVANQAASTIAGGVQTVATQAAGVIGGLFGRDDAFSQLANDLNGGSINMDLTGMGGSFEFSTDVYSNKEFVVPLVPGGGITLSPFQIQGILSIGPKVDPQLVFKFDSEEDLSFNYGFEYKVPEGAGLTLNFLDPKASKVNKLDQTTFKALPFSSNVKEVAASGLNYSMSFRPVVSVGITVLKNNIDPIELIFNVPKVSGNVAIAQAVDEKCKNEGEGDFDAFNVTSSFTFDMGVGSKIDVGVMNLKLDPSKVLVSKAGLFPMNTCVPFHKSTGPADGGDDDEETEDGDEDTEDGDEDTEEGDDDAEDADADADDADADDADADDADADDADADDADDADADADDADDSEETDDTDDTEDSDDTEDPDDTEDTEDSDDSAKPTTTAKPAAKTTAPAASSSPAKSGAALAGPTNINAKGAEAQKTAPADAAAKTTAAPAERRHARWFS